MTALMITVTIGIAAFFAFLLNELARPQLAKLSEIVKDCVRALSLQWRIKRHEKKRADKAIWEARLSAAEKKKEVKKRASLVLERLFRMRPELRRHIRLGKKRKKR